MGSKPPFISFSMILSLVSMPFGLANKLTEHEEILGSFYSSEEWRETNYLGLDAYFHLRNQFQWDRLLCTTGTLLPDKRGDDLLHRNKTELQLVAASLKNETVSEQGYGSGSNDLPSASEPWLKTTLAKKSSKCAAAPSEQSCREPASVYETRYCDPAPMYEASCCEEVPACFRLCTMVLAHGGFRFDQLSCTTGVLFPNNYEMFDDQLRAKDLQTYEVGGKALFALGAHWYMRGLYSYGWIFDGRYSDLFLRGKMKGNTQDGMAGIGYLYPINPYCGLGAVGGWAFNEQEPVLEDANEPQFNELRFQSIWNGPWLGLDFFAKSRNFNVTLGYEFHLASWRGSWLLERELANAFSDQRKGGLSFGQVVYADFRFNLGKHWLIEFEFKYQNWSTQGTGYLNSSGDVPFNSSPISGPVPAITFVKEATWESYGGSFNLGYRF